MRWGGVYECIGTTLTLVVLNAMANAFWWPNSASVALSLLIGIHYYFGVWHPAMLAQPPQSAGAVVSIHAAIKKKPRLHSSGFFSRSPQFTTNKKPRTSLSSQALS